MKEMNQKIRNFIKEMNAKTTNKAFYESLVKPLEVLVPKLKRQKSVSFGHSDSLIRDLINLPKLRASDLEEFLSIKKVTNLGGFMILEDETVPTNIAEDLQLYNYQRKNEFLEIIFTGNYGRTDKIKDFYKSHTYLVLMTAFQLCSDLNFSPYSIKNEKAIKIVTNVLDEQCNANRFSVLSTSRGPGVQSILNDVSLKGSQGIKSFYEIWTSFLEKNKDSVIVWSLGNGSLDFSSLYTAKGAIDQNDKEFNYLSEIEDLMNKYSDRFIIAVNLMEHSNIFSSGNDRYKLLREHSIFAPGLVSVAKNTETVEGTSFSAPIIAASIMRICKMGKTPVEAAKILLETGKIKTKTEFKRFQNTIDSLNKKFQKPIKCQFYFDNDNMIITANKINSLYPYYGEFFKKKEIYSSYKKVLSHDVSVIDPIILNVGAAVIKVAEENFHINYGNFISEISKISDVTNIVSNNVIKNIKNNFLKIDKSNLFLDNFKEKFDNTIELKNILKNAKFCVENLNKEYEKCINNVHISQVVEEIWNAKEIFEKLSNAAEFLIYFKEEIDRQKNN